jgi:cobalamin transport system substrate-binding protein
VRYALLLACAVLVACGRPAPPPARTGPPQRIVSSLPGITEMVAYLGAADRLVAVSPYCDYPPEVTALPRVQVHPFDPEAVLAAHADLVIVDARLHRRDLAVIRQRVPDVLVLDTSRSLEGVAVSMEQIAEALQSDDARRRTHAWRVRMETATKRIDPGTGPGVPVLVVGQWDPLYVLGKGSLIDDLVRLCGGLNVAWDLEGDASGTFSEELVLERRPRVVLTPRTPMPERIRQRWKDVPAVKLGRIVDGSADDLVRAGPRILAGLARLAGILREAAK